ncbi:MAG: STAS domain-containing protein [Oscillochloridaceae bacterium]|nr:STAS domain-containing protein [Chloroflexaceae bacterium]MDW8391009.1 STAS domain-containing protein [Oscillochloridaceae bacterium]
MVTELEAEVARLRRMLERRDAIITALAEVARLLSVHLDPRTQMSQMLAVLGEAVQVSRAYIFVDLTPDDDHAVISQVAEWVAPGITPQIDNPELQNLPFTEAGFGRWERLLKQNGVVYGRVADFPASEQKLLEVQDILALVAAPIFVGQRWWGFVGFDHCTVAHSWEAVEVEALRSAAVMFGAALYRRETEDRMLAAQREALRELSTPLIPITDDVVIMPLIGVIDSSRAHMVMETLLDGVTRQQARLVILDITGVPVVDSQVAQALIQAAQAVKLLGARVMLTGIQPQIAQTLVHLGVDLSGIQTQSSLQAGIAVALQG